MEKKTLLQKSKLPPEVLSKAAINLAKAFQEQAKKSQLSKTIDPQKRKNKN